MAEIPDAVIRALTVRPEFLGCAGPRVIAPLGVPSGMILAAATRASCTARVRWPQCVDWSRMSRLIRGFRPAPPTAQLSDEEPPKGIESAVNEEALDRQCGPAPAQPDDQSRVWGVKSFARSPDFSGKVSETASRQLGFCAPQSGVYGRASFW